MPRDFTAHIYGDDERAQWWREVFGGNDIQLRSFVPEWAILPGKGETLVYQLDIDALSPEQRSHLVDHISKRFNIPAGDVDDQLDIIGCPILAENVTVRVSNPQRWI